MKKLLIFIGLLITFSGFSQFSFNPQGNGSLVSNGYLGVMTSGSFSRQELGYGLLCDGTYTKVVFDDDAFNSLGAKTFWGWFNAKGLGENSAGMILAEDYAGSYRTIIRLESLYRILFTRSNTAAAYSASSSISFNKDIFFCITSTSTGITNFYVGDKDNTPTLSGNANQDAGTPEDRDNISIGGNKSGGLVFDGIIYTVQTADHIFTGAEITDKYNDFLTACAKDETKRNFAYYTAPEDTLLFRETFFYEPNGETRPKSWTVSSGSFRVSEKTDGTKYYSCTSAGSVYTNYLGATSATMSIDYLDGTWTTYSGTVASLVSTHSWLSLTGDRLIFTLTANDGFTNIKIVQ